MWLAELRVQKPGPGSVTKHALKQVPATNNVEDEYFQYEYPVSLGVGRRWIVAPWTRAGAELGYPHSPGVHYSAVESHRISSGFRVDGSDQDGPTWKSF